MTICRVLALVALCKMAVFHVHVAFAATPAEILIEYSNSVHAQQDVKSRTLQRDTITEPNGQRAIYEILTEYRRQGQVARVRRAEFSGENGAPERFNFDQPDWGATIATRDYAATPDSYILYRNDADDPRGSLAIFSTDSCGTSQRYDFPSIDPGAWMKGCICEDGQPLVVTLQDAATKLQTRLEMIDGVSCQALELHCKRGFYRAWFDKSRAANLMRLEIDRGPDDIVDEKPLWKRFHGVDEPRSPEDDLVREKITIENAVLEQTAAGWLPSALTVTTKITGPGAGTRTVVSEVTRQTIESSVVLSDDVIGIVEARVPDGAPVFFSPPTPISHEWRNGQVTARVEPAVIENIETSVDKARSDKANSDGSSGTSWQTTSLAVAAAAAALATFELLRRRTRNVPRVLS